MSRRFAAIFVCGGIAMLASACATKGFVREHVGATETRITQRVDSQEAKLRETSDRTASNTQAIEATGQRLQGLDGRVTEAKMGVSNFIPVIMTETCERMVKTR